MPQRSDTGDPRSQKRLRARNPGTTSNVTLAMLIFMLALSPDARGDEEERDFNANSHRTGPVAPAEDLDTLRRHFRASNKTNLGAAELERIYARIKADLGRRYAVSEITSIKNYQRWTRHNRVPYLSAAHGNRYVNNYTNPAGKAYGRFEQAGTMPVGTVIAKDTFTVADDGTVRPGPNLVMEKMPEGFNYVSGDWRYSAVMPDGSVLGVTNGGASESVEFCISCHLVMEHQDHLHFMPEEYRKKPE